MDPYTLTLSDLELVLMEDLLDYALDTFEAESPTDAARFQQTCESLLTKLAALRPSVPTLSDDLLLRLMAVPSDKLH